MLGIPERHSAEGSQAIGKAMHQKLFTGEFGEQRGADAGLLVGGELCSGRGEVEDVDGGLAFGFDQGDIDAAIVLGKS
jgi:hypothetical protein